MPDKKLTDNEIIKAYELCFAERGTSHTCGVCPYHKFGELCKVNRDKDALDLINRYEEKNSNLTSDLTSLQNDLTSAKAEIERLKEENNILSQNADTAFQDGLNEAQDLYAEQVKAEIKAEAYKEFAERLHKELRMYGTKDKFNKAVFLNVVDRAKKELVGEDK